MPEKSLNIQNTQFQKIPRPKVAQKKLTTVFLMGMLFTLTTPQANPTLADYLNQAQMVAAGRASFIANCSGCHGITGDGQGASAPMLSPKPRNLIAGSFKFRSTTSGASPTLADIVRTLNQGIPGTSMPSFRLHSEKEKLALALYVQSLNETWKANPQAEPLALASAPSGMFRDRVKFVEAAIRGKKLYMEACHTCHGDGGKGYGPGAEGLTDGENQPIRPADLSRPYVKSGFTERDVFRAITTGLDGSPMPSFLETYSDAQRWDLVSYVYYLRGQSSGRMPKNVEPEETLKKISALTGSKSKAGSATKTNDWN